jgi:phage terminase small subunit
MPRVNLTEKQSKYVQGRVAGLKQRDAAIAAGYSPAGADVQAANLDKHPQVKAAIAKAKRAGARGMTSMRNPPRGDEPGDDEAVLKDHYDTPLDFMLDTMNNPRMPKGVRFEAAKQALPYVNGKVGDVGKKQSQQNRAKAITEGGGTTTKSGRANKFSPKAPPTRGGNVVQLRGGR